MEGDAGTGRLNPPIDSDTPASDGQPDPADVSTDASTDVTDETQASAPADEPDELAEPVDSAAPGEVRRPSRLGIASVAAIGVGLLVLAAATATGGYYALKADQRGTVITDDDAAALAAAKDCVAATQAPDTAAMTIAQSKILECSTGEFGVQAGLLGSVLTEVYQASNAKVAVDDMRAAVERHNDDGSINVLVALRVKITNSQAADQQVGYRLRATMAFDEGQYRIARLDQVTS
jgi:Mce-associated membrane protein